MTQNSPSDSDSASRATLTTTRMGHVLVLRLAGELDLDGVTILDGCLVEGPTAITLDLSRLGFCDSTGLNVLLRLRLDAEKRGIDVHLAAPSPQVARILGITGTDKVFPVHASVQDALAALAPD